MALSEFQRSLISRAAMAVVGVALLFGGRASLRVSHRIYADDAARERQLNPNRYVTDREIDDASAYRLPFLIGVGLVCVGVLFVLGAVLPNRVLYRLPFFAEPGAGSGAVEELFR